MHLKSPHRLPPPAVRPSTFSFLRDRAMSGILDRRQLLKIFPDTDDKIDDYIREDHIRIDSRDDLVKLISYCNEILSRSVE